MKSLHPAHGYLEVTTTEGGRVVGWVVAHTDERLYLEVQAGGDLRRVSVRWRDIDDWRRLETEDITAPALCDDAESEALERMMRVPLDPAGRP